MSLKKKICNLTSSDRYVITLSILNEKSQTILTEIESNNFLTSDLPIARSETSKLLFDMHHKEKAVKNDSVIQDEINQVKIKDMLE